MHSLRYQQPSLLPLEQTLSDNEANTKKIRAKRYKIVSQRHELHIQFSPVLFDQVISYILFLIKPVSSEVLLLVTESVFTNRGDLSVVQNFYGLCILSVKIDSCSGTESRDKKKICRAGFTPFILFSLSVLDLAQISHAFH